MTSETPFSCPYSAVFADLHGHQGKVVPEISPDTRKAMRTRKFRQCLKCENIKECEGKED